MDHLPALRTWIFIKIEAAVQLMIICFFPDCTVLFSALDNWGETAKGNYYLTVRLSGCNNVLKIKGQCFAL